MIIPESSSRIWHRRVWLLSALLLTVAANPGGCSRPADKIEPGGLLLQVSVPTSGALPGELRVWTYDDNGVVFRNAAVAGSAAAQAGGVNRKLGTVLIQPGASDGQLRLHVRGMLDGTRILDGVARVPADARAQGRFDLILGTEVPADADGDDVPDLIDDCPEQPDPDQMGCPGSSSDASTDGAPVHDGATADGSKGGAGGSVVAGTGGAVGSGGTPGTGGQTMDASAPDATTGGADAQTRDAQAAETTGGGRKNAGVSCAAAGECSSGFCVDGVCCLRACNGECESCGAFGLCTTVNNKKDVPECAGTNTCNNRGKCVAN